MSAAERAGDWAGVESALERYFLARERGETVDVDAICHGDEQLARRLQEVLDRAPDLITTVSGATTDLSPRQSFGDFEILEQIGRGGMGTVYLARQRSLGRDVALKVLDRSISEQPGARARLRREAELTALLEHASIVPVYAVGEVDGVPFIAMKHLLGPSLAEVERPWSADHVARTGIALAEALDAAHVHGVVHRDVKPANILLDGDVPVFVDFGLARAQSDPTLTQEGKVAGTLRYMAPERLEAGTAVLDPRVDVYGLGATLYELLAGRELFADRSPTALVRSVIARDPAPLRLRGRDHDLETIVMRALAKEPERRFATAGEMAADLRRYLDGEPVLSRKLSRAARVLRVLRRYPRASVALAIALLVAVVAVAVSITEQVQSSADRDRRLAQARVDVGEFRHARAHDSLHLLAQRHPDDGEVASWLATARIELAIDQLFEVAVDHGDNISAAAVTDLLAVFDHGASSRQRSLAAFAGVVALGQRGDHATARDFLRRLPPDRRESRLGRAVTAWLAAAPLPWTLPPAAGDRAPGAAVLTALVLRTAGVAPGAVMAELTAPRGADRFSPRRRFFEAIVHLDLGRTDVAAGLLRGLASPDAPPVVWRWLASAELRLGDLDAAADALENAAADRSPAADYHRLALEFERARSAGDTAAVAELVERLRRDPRRTDWQERFLAEYEGKSAADRAAEACERLARLSDRTTHPYGREMLTAHQIEITGWHLPGPAIRDGSARPSHCELLATWEERADALVHPVARTIADTWIARSLCCTERPGDLDRGLERFRAAADRGGGSSRLALEYAGAVGALDAEAVNEFVIRTHALAARRALDVELARSESGPRWMPPELVSALRRWALLMSWRAGDYVDLARRLPGVEGLLEGEERSGARQLARWAEGVLDAFRRR